MKTTRTIDPTVLARSVAALPDGRDPQPVITVLRLRDLELDAVARPQPVGAPPPAVVRLLDDRPPEVVPVEGGRLAGIGSEVGVLVVVRRPPVSREPGRRVRSGVRAATGTGVVPLPPGRTVGAVAPGAKVARRPAVRGLRGLDAPIVRTPVAQHAVTRAVSGGVVKAAVGPIGQTLAVRGVPARIGAVKQALMHRVVLAVPDGTRAVVPVAPAWAAHRPAATVRAVAVRGLAVRVVAVRPVAVGGLAARHAGSGAQLHRPVTSHRALMNRAFLTASTSRCSIVTCGLSFGL